MPAERDKPEGAAADLENLMGWLEDERTRDLVDMINRAAQGLPVQDAADRYKARYRHNESMEKLSDMFDNLKPPMSRTSEVLADCSSQLQLGLRQLELSRAAFEELRQETTSLRDESRQLQGLLDELRQISDYAREFRELVISLGSGEQEQARDRLRIIGLGG